MKDLFQGFQVGNAKGEQESMGTIVKKALDYCKIFIALSIDKIWEI